MVTDFLNLRPKPTCCNQLLHQVSTTNKMPWKLGAERLQLRSELDEAKEEAEGRRLEAWFKPPWWWSIPETVGVRETKRVDRLLLIDGRLDRGNPATRKRDHWI